MNEVVGGALLEDIKDSEQLWSFLESMGDFGFLLIDGREVIWEITHEEGQLILKKWESTFLHALEESKAKVKK